jgi:4,5-dihydroxyphthalate decarboxylase
MWRAWKYPRRQQTIDHTEEFLALAFFMNSMEEQNRLLGRDPWQYGLNEINRNDVATALRYANEQGLTGKPHSLEEMFHPIDDWTWTGTEGF